MKKIMLFLAVLPAVLFSQTVCIDQINSCDDRLSFQVSAHGYNVVGAVSMKISLDSELIYDSIANLSPRFQVGFCIHNFNISENSLYFSWFDPVYWFFCADTMKWFDIYVHRQNITQVQNIYFDQTCNYCNEIGDSAGVVQPTQWINGYVLCNPACVQEYIHEFKKDMFYYNILGQRVRFETQTTILY